MAAGTGLIYLNEPTDGFSVLIARGGSRERLAMSDEGERTELLERLARYRRLLRDTIDPMARAAIEETIQELEERLDRPGSTRGGR